MPSFLSDDYVSAVSADGFSNGECRGDFCATLCGYVSAGRRAFDPALFFVSRCLPGTADGAGRLRFGGTAGKAMPYPYIIHYSLFFVSLFAGHGGRRRNDAFRRNGGKDMPYPCIIHYSLFTKKTIHYSLLILHY
jgi:hypothetical protein